MDELLDKLYSFIVNRDEILGAIKPIHGCLNKTFESCFEPSSFLVKSDKHLEIESILDFLHDELNTGHWSDIPLQIRRAFTAASFTKTAILIKSASVPSPELLAECLKTLDMGLLLGAPLEINMLLLTQSATFLSTQMDTELESNFSVKRKFENEATEEFRDFKATLVDCMSCPSLETFNKYFTTKVPLKLQDCVSHWPALSKWTDVNYLLKVAGERTVPIEIGSHYADEDWRQKLVTLKEFIKNYFLGESQTVGYLAQHNLFDQIPELRNDIYVPDYCCLGDDSDESEEPAINAWFGPSGTVSPLHYDPKNNLLVQVFGTKQLVLYPPKDSPFLYPHDSTLLSNTAQVDPFKPDPERFPDFAKAAPHKCVLEPGEMLYIPPQWWHHVTATDKSFSVSFWWD